VPRLTRKLQPAYGKEYEGIDGLCGRVLLYNGAAISTEKMQ
jgi:hypothetical protein